MHTLLPEGVHSAHHSDCNTNTNQVKKNTREANVTFCSIGVDQSKIDTVRIELVHKDVDNTGKQHSARYCSSVRAVQHPHVNLEVACLNPARVNFLFSSPKY